MCMESQQVLPDGSPVRHYDVHSLYGWAQTRPTYEWVIIALLQLGQPGTGEATLLLLSFPLLRVQSVSSVTQSCPTLCDPMDCSTLGFPVHHQLPELIQTHVHWVGNVIQPSYPLSSPSPLAFNLSQHQCLFKWVSTSHQVAKVLELQHQSFQWKFRTDFL